MSTNSPFPSAAMPAQREFRAGAHQALLAANGRDTFYTLEIQRAITGPGSPLERFLPGATYTVSPRVTGSTGGGARVAFQLDSYGIESARPLRGAQAQAGALALPGSEIEAFALAVRQFLAPAAGITPLQQQCRREFRLPDPVREPDAYWVVGSGFDRRLLILWGCERFARTSVPLDRVVEHLRTCEMAWEDKQQLAIQLATRKDEPLSRFLARPAKGGDGGLAVREAVLPAKSLKPFMHFSRDAWQSFDAAARAFVHRAEEAGVAPFEAELRREFRVPSLAAAPARFYRHGSQVVVDISPLDRSQCVPPAPGSGGDAADSSAAPLNEQLQKRIKFQGTPYLIAGGAVALLALGGAGFWVFGPDREPPRFVELQAESPRRVAVLFSEPMPAELPAGAIAFVDDKRKVASVRPDPLEELRLIVELSPETPMIDGETYGLVLAETVVDRAGNPLAYTSEKFTYYDPVAPDLIAGPTRISAGGQSSNDLVLTFTKPLDKDSLDGGGFIITPLSGGQPGKRVPIKDAKLDPDVREGTRVIVTADEPFQSRVKYTLTVNRVTDRAKKPNRAKIENLEFEYVDVLPPSVRKIVEAKAAAYRLQIEFSKPLDKTTALTDTNYLIHRPGSTEAVPLLQRISAGGATLDESGRFLTLALERGPLVPGKHRLVVVRAADDKGNHTERAIEREFEFADAGQRGAPKFAAVRPSEGDRVELEFDRGLAPASVVKERFRILNAERQPSDLTVTSASLSPEDSRRVSLSLSRAPAGGVAYHVRAEDLEDVFGTRQDSPEISAAFRAVGTTRPIEILRLKNAPRLVSDRQIVIMFDKVATRDSAENPAQYILRPAGTPAPQSARLELVKDAEGNETQSKVTLSFAAPFTGQIEVGISRLQFESDQTGAQYRVPPVRAEIAP